MLNGISGTTKKIKKNENTKKEKILGEQILQSELNLSECAGDGNTVSN